MQTNWHTGNGKPEYKEKRTGYKNCTKYDFGNDESAVDFMQIW